MDLKITEYEIHDIDYCDFCDTFLDTSTPIFVLTTPKDEDMTLCKNCVDKLHDIFVLNKIEEK